MRRWTAEIPNRCFCLIEHSEGVGFFLYVFEAGSCTADYMQDDLEMAKEDALEFHQVPKGEWSELADQSALPRYVSAALGQS